MNENRFTEKAKDALQYAAEAALEMGQDYVGTEHLLVGLIRESDGVAGKILEANGVTDDMAIEKIDALIGTGEPIKGVEPEATPRTKRVLENSYVEARENSSVEAWGNSSVEASGNSQISQKSDTSKIKTSGNARIVRDPCSIDEYVDFYGIENSNGKAKLFKAVRKCDGLYRSGWDSDFVYTIGKSVVADGFCTDPNEDCGHGIHMAYLNWCLVYGSPWHDLAILEVEVDMSTVVVPKYSSGKVRAPSCKVIREVPLEECGLYGKILARRYGG